MLFDRDQRAGTALYPSAHLGRHQKGTVRAPPSPCESEELAVGPGLWVLPSRSLISENLLYSLQRTLENTTGEKRPTQRTTASLPSSRACCRPLRAGFPQNDIRLTVSINKSPSLLNRDARHRRRKHKDGYTDAERYEKPSGPELALATLLVSGRVRWPCPIPHHLPRAGQELHGH